MSLAVTVKHISEEEIKERCSYEDAVRITEQAFLDYENKDSRMPEKIYLNLPQFEGDFRAMPALDNRYQIAGIKWVNSHKRNPSKGLPSVSATLLVNDPETGQLLAILEAGLLTALRTGAAGAIAAKYLSSNRASRIAFIGTGVQAHYQWECTRLFCDLKTVDLFDLNTKCCDAFAKSFGSDIQVHCHDSIESCVKEADIIVTTTPSTQPLIQLSWLKPGAHINAIGADAPEKQELDVEILKDAVIIVDDIAQASHSGEVSGAIEQGDIQLSDIYASIGALIKSPESALRDRLTVFDSTGLAVQDLALAGHLLNR